MFLLNRLISNDLPRSRVLAVLLIGLLLALAFTPFLFPGVKALNVAAKVLVFVVLVASFVLTGVSFLAFAVIAAKRGATTTAHGRKSFFYSTGLAEGAETIAVFAAMCLLPPWFAVLAYGYAALCALTVIQRSAMAASSFSD